MSMLEIWVTRAIAIRSSRRLALIAARAKRARYVC